MENYTDALESVIIRAGTNATQPAGLALLAALVDHPAPLHAHEAMRLAGVHDPGRLLPAAAALDSRPHQSHLWFEREEAQFLRRSATIATDLGHNYLGARHLLLGLALGEGGSDASPPFLHVGLTYVDLRRAVLLTFSRPSAQDAD